MNRATRENHGRHQRILAHGFSNQAMVAQQTLIQGYVSLLMQRLKQAIETGESQEVVGCKLLIMLALTKEQRRQFVEHFQLSQAAIGKRLAVTNIMNDFQMTDEDILHNTRNLVLATHKDVLTKLENEVKTGFNSEEEITLSSVHKSDYMFAITEESLRVFPAAPPAIPRITPAEGATIRGGYIPPKAMVSIWQWSMGHSPEHFKDPESFIPERWLGDPRFASDRRQAIQAFSWGPRNCIGKNLAYAEMRLIMARLIWNFNIALDPRSEGWIARNKLNLL
ncbi:cytochrome P450 [Seiridium cupressi]